MSIRDCADKEALIYVVARPDAVGFSLAFAIHHLGLACTVDHRALKKALKGAWRNGAQYVVIAEKDRSHASVIYMPWKEELASLPEKYKSSASPRQRRIPVDWLTSGFFWFGEALIKPACPGPCWAASFADACVAWHGEE